MGEVSVKSGNLIQSVTSYPATDIYVGSLYVEADLKPDTQYTFAFKLTEGYFVYWNEFLFTTASPIIVGKGDEIIIVTKTTKSVVSKDNINQYNSNYGGWSITKNNKTEETTGVYTEVQLLEGAYTSSTIPEYQPYFLNRPAHKFTNGEWIDIPTHKYTNGRWQGELTSQSPLRFRADGEMLDWRIEGASGGVGDWDEAAQKYKIPVNVKGGTLFDISDTYSAIPSKYNITNDTISMVLTTDWGGNFIKFDKTYEAGTYTFRANITKDSNMTISLWSDKSFVGSSYNSYYKGYARAFNGSLQTYTFSEDFRIGFAGSGATGLSGSISDFQILKGTYTSETMPPYESYITNLYTDHQLLDGDSIDYTTDQTAIPLATGNNVLTVDTAVQPKSVFVKFEG